VRRRYSVNRSSSYRPMSSPATTTFPEVGRSIVTYEESGRLLEFYEDGLQGYTYLEEPREK
jgi:hypothetical protein